LKEIFIVEGERDRGERICHWKGGGKSQKRGRSNACGRKRKSGKDLSLSGRGGKRGKRENWTEE